MNYDDDEDFCFNHETFDSWMFDRRESYKNNRPRINVNIDVSHIYRSSKAISEGNFFI